VNDNKPRPNDNKRPFEFVVLLVFMILIFLNVLIFFVKRHIAFREIKLTIDRF
jgi:hypothetical protein